jgi:hypothetical protein
MYFHTVFRIEKARTQIFVEFISAADFDMHTELAAAFV